MSVFIPLDKIHDYLSQSLTGVLETMARSRCTLLKKENYQNRNAESPESLSNDGSGGLMYTSSVGFAGEINGICYLFMSDRFAQHISQKITGLDLSDLDEATIRDVCGELTNMFAGGFKNALADLGLTSTLTLPTVMHGVKLAISTTGAAEHYRFSFEVDGYSIVADLLLADRSQ